MIRRHALRGRVSRARHPAGLSVGLTRETSRALLVEYLGNAGRQRRISREQASALVFQRYATRFIIPVGPAINEVVSAAFATHGQK